MEVRVTILVYSTCIQFSYWQLKKTYCTQSAKYCCELLCIFLFFTFSFSLFPCCVLCAVFFHSSYKYESNFFLLSTGDHRNSLPWNELSYAFNCSCSWGDNVRMICSTYFTDRINSEGNLMYYQRLPNARTRWLLTLRLYVFEIRVRMNILLTSR